jgi:hypothetical protein
MDIPSVMELGNGKYLVLKTTSMDLCHVLVNFMPTLSKQ